jgi:hypothetical protein
LGFFSLKAIGQQGANHYRDFKQFSGIGRTLEGNPFTSFLKIQVPFESWCDLLYMDSEFGEEKPGLVDSVVSNFVETLKDS